MKKLILMALALGVGCSLNAASFTWGFQNNMTKAPDGEYFGEGDYANASAFLFLGSSTISDGKFNIAALTQIAYVSAMDTSDYNWGVFSTDSMPSSDKVNADASRVGQAYTLVLVAEGGLTKLVEGTEYQMIAVTGTSQINPDPSTSGDTAYYANFVDTAIHSNWSSATVSVPEPTSGLLLLIGMAVLALKRKHA